MSGQSEEELRQIAGLNETDQNKLKEAIWTWLSILLLGLIWRWWKKITNSKVVKTANTWMKVANEFGKRNARKMMQRNYQLKDYVWELPEGTEILNEKWQPNVRSTEQWWEFTPRWSFETWKAWVKWYIEAFKNAWNWFMRNKDSALVTRDPNAPVWELPNVMELAWEEVINKPVEWEIIKEEEITPERQKEVEEKWFYADEKPIVKETPAKETKVVNSENQNIGEYLKKISNEITGKKWWMNKDLYEKFSTSKELQSEYINTIDPYLRENWANNPSWVIDAPLAEFIETVKDQIQERLDNNIKFRKWQIKYKVEVPTQDKIKLENENKEYKHLIKLLSKDSKDSEKFLNYLLNLPEERIETLNKLIPDFSKNLGLIKDTLDITKAITSSDLLWKFLQFKSTRWTRRRNFIRRYIYKKLNEAYKKAWVKRNMYEIEKMINQLSEEDLIELEEAMKEDNIPAYMKQDFINNLYDKLDKRPIEAVDWKKIWQTTIQLPKKTREEIIEWELTKQGYRRETDTTPEYQTEEALRQHKLPDWTTVWDWMDRTETHLSPKAFKDLRLSEADFWNKAINYNRNGLKMTSFMAWHEIAHFILGKLTTSELFDLTERIRKLTKDSGKEVNRVGMGEYLSDTISNYWNHWDIDWLKNLLTQNLWWVKKEITDHIQNLLESFKKDKLFQKREPRYESTRYQGWVTARERMDFLRKIDSNLKDYSYDLDVNSPTFSEMRFNMKDWKSLSREEWKDTLSHDQ